jgi:hypothetical protein
MLVVCRLPDEILREFDGAFDLSFHPIDGVPDREALYSAPVKPLPSC